jgi:apolipoprotein D and lipocalin family protein
VIRPKNPLPLSLHSQYASGVWYDVLRFETSFSRGCDCGFANYNLNKDNSVGVRNCCKRLPDTTLSCKTGQAVLAEPDHVPLEGKLTVSFPHRRKVDWTYQQSLIAYLIAATNASNYLVLSTDYDNYSIVYFCRNIEDNKSSEYAWILSRQPQLNQAAKATADGLIDAHFDRSEMYAAEQSGERCEPRDP